MLTDRDLMDHLESFLRFGITRSMLYLHLLWTSTAYSQRTSTSFGPTVDFSLGYTPVGVVRSIQSGVAILAQEPPAVFFYALAPKGLFVQTDHIAISNRSQGISSELNEKGGVIGYAVLAADGRGVSVVHQVRGALEEKTILLDVPSQRMSYGDVNSDKRTDILLFGTRRTGITPLLKQKDGRYILGEAVFPDVSISDLRCKDLNGDNISDLLILDWVSNQLALFYGIGRGVFSEQVGINLPGEPANIAISPVSKERTVRIAVSIPEEKLVALFRCNATGEIEGTGTLEFDLPPKQVEFDEINGDRTLDLVVSTDRSIVVFLGGPNMRLGSPTPFGLGKQIASFEIADLDGDLNKDLVAIDHASNRLVACASANWSGTIEWSATYGVGAYPRGITTTDVNGDGLLDVIVANSGSSTLSVLLNRGGGMLAGQQVVHVSDQPFSVKAIGSSSRSRIVLAPHPRSERVSIVKISEDVNISGILTFPTGPNPYIVLAKQDSIPDHLELLIRYSTAGDNAPSLSYFRQIPGGQLVERNIRASVSGRITALTVDDFSGSGRYEIVFAVHDKGTRQSILSLASPTQGFEFKTGEQIVSFSDSVACVHSLVSGYVDDDQHRDVIVVMSHPRNALGVLYGKGGGTFRDSLDILPHIQLLDEDAIVLRDADIDGHMDLTWIDAGKNAVMTLYGRGNRRFEPPVNVCPAEGVTSIQIAGIKSPNVQDLLLANGSKGSLTLMVDPFR